MTDAYAGTVSGVDLPMLQFSIERDFLDLAFDEMLSTTADKDLIDEILSTTDNEDTDDEDLIDEPLSTTDDEGVPAIALGDIPVFATWYLSRGDWQGYGVLKVIHGYEWAVDFFQLGDTPAGEIPLVGAITLSQRRLGEVEITFGESHPGLFCDFLIDWLRDEYACEVDELPDPLGGPLSWAEPDDATDLDDEPTAQIAQSDTEAQVDLLGLTPTEAEIAMTYAQGQMAKEISVERVIGQRTVEDHLAKIGGKVKAVKGIERRLNHGELRSLLKELGYG